MNAKKDAAFFDAAFVALGFVFRDAHADESPGNAADSAAYADSGESGHDGTGGDEGTEAGNGQGSDAGQPAEAAAYYGSGGGAGGSAFGSFGAFAHGEILCAYIFREEDRDVGVAKSGCLEGVDG